MNFKSLLMGLVILFSLNVFSAEKFPSPEFKQRWLLLMGCWENKQAGQYWCNAPSGPGSNIRHVLEQTNWEIRLLEQQKNRPPELACFEMGQMKSEYSDLRGLLENLSEMNNVSADLKRIIENDVLAKMNESTDYEYWGEMEAYCHSQDPQEFRNQDFLLRSMKRYLQEVFVNGGSLFSVGLNASFKEVNHFLGVEIPFDQDVK